MKISEMNWMQVEEYLRKDDRAVVPLGSTEQHAYLSLSTDSILSERVSVEAAEPLAIPVFPVLSYGISSYFCAYPGTVTLRTGTYVKVVTDILDSLSGSGFRRILLVSGHGGNEPADYVASERMADNPDVQVKFFQWWKGPDMAAVALSIDPVCRHASWSENFAWTRISGVELPEKPKNILDRTGYPKAGGKRLRELIGDGNYGGNYQRSDEDMQAIWQAAVEETRAMIEKGWDES